MRVVSYGPPKGLVVPRSEEGATRYVKVYGIDFTSAPSEAKPITCAVCQFAEETLELDFLVEIQSLEVFSNFLASEGPWIAGVDFPFGQPRPLVQALGWPENWEDMVRRVASMSMEEFETALGGYRDARPEGRKQPLRESDRRAGALSPMMLHGVPVGRMFFRGAPLLASAAVSVLPCRPMESGERIVLEAYPGLLVRRLVGEAPYKSDRRDRQSAEQRSARLAILEQLVSSGLREIYGFDLSLHAEMAGDMADDPKGDHLDAMLCAVQAAWAWSRRDAGFGIPDGADALEGWIVDPATNQH